MTLAKLRVCASCEWIFKLDEGKCDCPKCLFGSYGAYNVYGNLAYRYAVSQKPWFDKNMAARAIELRQEIKTTI